MLELEWTEKDFIRNPILFVELAHRWAAGGPAPTMQHEEWMKELSRPCLRAPAQARDALWGVMSFPERGRGLVWLDRMGLLQELLPCWRGERDRRNKRLQSVEEVHLERWASGLTAQNLKRISKRLDETVNGRLNRWALTSLACLLLTGDVPADEHLRSVQRDLTAIGATSKESGAVMLCCTEYPLVYQSLVNNNSHGSAFDEMSVVACLSSLFAYPNLADDVRRAAVARADKVLRKEA